MKQHKVRLMHQIWQSLSDLADNNNTENDNNTYDKLFNNMGKPNLTGSTRMDDNINPYLPDDTTDYNLNGSTENYRVSGPTLRSSEGSDDDHGNGEGQGFSEVAQ
jgi:hypothetical protein